MKPLIEELHDNNVLFSYYGFIDSSVLSEVLQITKSKLEGNRESPLTVQRVHEAINDCVDNIIKHNFYPDDSRVRYKSLLVVSKAENQYEIDTINIINADQKKSLDAQLGPILNKSKQELLVLQQNPSPEVQSGILQFLLKADHCDCSFKAIDENHLFNICYRVGSSN